MAHAFKSRQAEIEGTAASQTRPLICLCFTELDFVGRILSLLEPMMDKIEALLSSPSTSLEWRNDYCRHTSHVRYSIGALSEVWQEFSELKQGGEEHYAFPYVIASILLAMTGLQFDRASTTVMYLQSLWLHLHLSRMEWL